MRFFRAPATLAVLALLGLVSGCTLLPGAGNHAQTRSAPFDLLGRVLVSYDGKGFTSNMRWLHGTERDELWLSTPTGQTLAYIVDTYTGATLTTADQTTYHAGSVEALTQRALGWELPLARLQYWVRGAQAPGIDGAVSERDNTGRPIKLTQDGWQVSYVYYTAPEQDAQPRRMELSKGVNQIRLVIDRWRHESDKP